MPNSSPSPLATLLPGEAPPTFKHCPAPRSGRLGQVVITAASRVGLSLDPWQRDVVLDAMSHDPHTDAWHLPRVAVSVPRQNGKGAIIEAIELAFLLGAFPGAELLIHSAHEYKTAQNAFQRIQSYFQTVPVLMRLVDEGRVKIGVSTAREFITVDGRTLKFLARSKGSGRGFSADLLVLDEAQELSEDVFAAILPTVSARPNPQIWLFGTPPSEAMNGEVFKRFRDTAFTGNDTRLAYFEWSAAEEDDFSDPAVWAKANPAQGVRISESAIRDEFNIMDEETFCRERLGMWSAAASKAVFRFGVWEALASETDPTGRVAFAVDVSPDRSRASIGVAGWLDDGERFSVQVVDNRNGTGWVVQRLVELTSRHPAVSVVVDAGGPAASLIPALQKARIRRLNLVQARDVAKATGAFYDAVVQQTLAHPDQPVLNEAVAVARKRPLGDAWAWHRKDPVYDITPLVAVTLAAYGLVTSRRASTGPRRAVVL